MTTYDFGEIVLVLNYYTKLDKETAAMEGVRFYCRRQKSALSGLLPRCGERSNMFVDRKVKAYCAPCKCQF
jgi:hypothetical protein